MADKCRFEGETVRHFNAGKLAVFELRAEKSRKDDIQVNIISKFITKGDNPNVTCRVIGAC